MTTYPGVIQSVYASPIGSFPVEPTAAGGLIVTFDDASDFPEDGGQIVVDDVVRDYSSVDLETDVMTLVSGFPFALDENTFVAPLPLSEETFAVVVLDDDSVEALVPHSLKALLPDGDRETDTGEAVMLQETERGWEIRDIVGDRPAVPAQYVSDAGNLFLNEEMRTLQESLAAGRAAVQAAMDNIARAEARLDNAFDEIEIKADQDYVDAAKQQAIDAAAIEAQKMAGAKGTDLIVNGTGYLKNNYNFSSFTYDPSDAPTGATGSFRSKTPGVSTIQTSDEQIPVDPNKTYRLAAGARQKGVFGGRIYTGLAPYDSAGEMISPYHYAYQPNTTTKLTQPLKPGDTVVYVESTANWSTAAATHLRTILVWNYTDEFGKTWPRHTYSRIYVPDAYAAAGGLAPTSITLSAPWPANMGTHPAGTEISNGTSGGNYMYHGWANQQVPTDTWEVRTGIVGGGSHDGSLGAATTKFPAGTATVKFLSLMNRSASGTSQADSDIAIGGISLSDAAAAQALAVLSVSTEYSVSSSETLAPISGWSTSTPTRTPGTFVWYRSSTLRGDGTVTVSAPALLTGNTGATGQPGPQGGHGIQGPKGADGSTLYTWIKYADTPTTGMSDSPTGKTYMGIAYNKTTATESSTYGDYEWSLIKGADGSQGIQGPKGADGSPTYTWIKYGTSSAGAGLSDLPTGKTYIGIAYNKTTPTESTTPSDYEWSLIQGPQGAQGGTGPTGISVSSVTPYYQKVAAGAAAPAAPTTNPPAAAWTATEPTYTANTDLYRTERILYSNNTFAYTAVTLVSAYTAAAYAVTQTDGVSKTVTSTALPGTTRLPQNSVWYVIDGAGKIAQVYNQTAASSGTTHGNTWVARPITSAALDNVDIGILTAAGGSINSLVAQKFATALATIITAEIGNLTVTGGSKLTDVVAVSMAADIGRYVEIIADKITGGMINATVGISAAGAIVCGDPDGARVEITRDGGVSVWTLGPNGMPFLGTRLSATEVSLAVMGQDGTQLAGIDPLGNVTGKRVDAAEQMTIRGTPFLGLVDGGDQPGWSDNSPRGIIARNEKIGVPGKQVATGVEARNISVAATLRKGRLYRIKSAIGVMPGTANSGIRTRIRYATGSAYPTTSSPECGPTMTGATYYTGGITITYLNEGFYQPTVDQRVTFLITYQGLGGATPTRYDSSIYIEDVGPATTVIGGSDDDTSAQVVYQSVWRATASRMYRRQDGDKAIAGNDGKVDVWYWNGTPQQWDSSAWVYGGGAVESTDSLELGKSMGGTGGALVGATLIKSEVFIKNKVWYGAKSGHLALSSLASATLPATKAIEATLWSPQKLAAGQGMWVEVPTTWFTNGANLGVCIGDRDSQALNGAGVMTAITSGSFHGANDAEPPLVRHTYSR